MFKKVLIVEDFDVINCGIKTAVEEIGIEQVEYDFYCDEAYFKIKNSYINNDPFDLLISDLSFENDGTPQRLKSGLALIEKVKIEFPNLKIIVFSIEDKPFKIQHLYHNLKIQGYVWKNRNGLKELKKAIHFIFENTQFYISPDLNHAIHPKKAVEISDFDIYLIESLSKGLLQEDISLKLKEKEISPCSVSAIEKRLKFLREHFNANNPAHLVAIAKDFGLI